MSLRMHMRILFLLYLHPDSRTPAFPSPFAYLRIGVLKDALARVPADDEVEFTEALADLKRMCCSTSYMFMYSQVWTTSAAGYL